MENTDFDLVVGKNLMKYRTEAGLTQAELADLIHVSTTFISRVERGRKRMKVQTLYAAAQALHVSCDALLSVDEVAGHMHNINKLLAEQPAEHLAGIERIIRVCAEEFNARREKPT